LERLSGRAFFIVLAVALLLQGGCGGRDDSLQGFWTGAFRDSRGGLGGGSLTFTGQSGTSLLGSWKVFFQTFGALAQFNSEGSFTGTVDGGSISLVLTPSKGSCSFHLEATRSGHKLAGTYSAIDCATPQTGSFDLEKT
jgi:hypothetical protein